MTTRVFAWALLLALIGGSAGCAVVPQNRRKRLAESMMGFDADALAANKNQKFYSTREAAAGGDGAPAGGGCGCQ
jgi:Domain of unknown function (DUF4266)